MKQKGIFRNAYFSYISGQVWKDGESEKTVYYTVVDANSKKEHSVKLEYDQEKKVLTACCDCTIASIKSKHLPLCSHIMAAIQRATYELGKKKK